MYKKDRIERITEDITTIFDKHNVTTDEAEKIIENINVVRYMVEGVDIK